MPEVSLSQLRPAAATSGGTEVDLSQLKPIEVDLSELSTPETPLQRIARYQKMVDAQKPSEYGWGSVNWNALKGLAQSAIAAPFKAASHYGDLLGQEMGDYWDALKHGDLVGMGKAGQAMTPGLDFGTDIAKGAVDQLKQAKAEYNNTREMPNPVARMSSAAGHVLAAAVPMVGPGEAEAGQEMGEGLGSGDANKFAEGAGKAVGLALPFTETGKTLGSDILNTEVRNPRDWAADKFSDAISAKNHEQAAEKVAKSLRGSHGKYDGLERMDRSLPLIKEAAGDQPINTAEDLIGKPDLWTNQHPANVPEGSVDPQEGGLIGKARRSEFAKFDQYAKEVNRRGATIKGDAIADAIEKHGITETMRTENSPQIDAIKKLADSYRGKDFAFNQLNDIVDQGNKDLASYYARNPSAKVDALANPDTATTAAKINTARNLQYDLLDRFGYGDAARNAMANAGALKELRRAFEKRKPVDERSAPDSLGEQWAKRHGLLRIGKGILDMTGSPWSKTEGGGGGQFARGAEDAFLGGAEIFLGKKIRELQGTDGLVARAFRNYGTGKPGPAKWIAPTHLAPVPTRPAPFGLLEAGDPTPDFSDLGSRHGDVTDLIPSIDPQTGSTKWVPRWQLDHSFRMSEPGTSSVTRVNAGPADELSGFAHNVREAELDKRVSPGFRNAYEPAIDKTRPGSVPPPDTGNFDNNFSEPTPVDSGGNGKLVTYQRNGQRYSGNVEAIDGNTLSVRHPNGVLRKVDASEVLGPVPNRNMPTMDRSATKTGYSGIAQHAPMESDGLRSPGFPEPNEVIHPKIDRPKVEEFPIGSKVGWKGPNGQKYTVTIESVGDDTLTVRTAGNAKRVISKSDVIKPEKDSKGIAQGKRKKK